MDDGRRRTLLGATGGRSTSLDMFPYPSGAGLHVGHPEGYTASDVMSAVLANDRHDVLHPIGVGLLRTAGGAIRSTPARGRRSPPSKT
ncbi:hypothetical protein ACHAW5_001554 [Stephanodiscus triporus]|uniref:leucine--tRNA ligase n=1 Tax=Stephanodiscus triporus TaxID=2934178 RepID=A0ABD3NI06_9STRA